MIGLMFFGAIGLWVVMAIVLGQKIPQWFKLKPAWGFLFVPLVLFAPVGDEIIAWPQIQMLCRNVEGYKFSPGIDEKTAAGRVVNFEIYTAPFSIFPSTVHVDRRKYVYIDSRTREPVFESSTYVVRRSLVGKIVGGYILRSVFLSGCSYDEDRNQREILHRLDQLNIILKPES